MLNFIENTVSLLAPVLSLHPVTGILLAGMQFLELPSQMCFPKLGFLPHPHPVSPHRRQPGWARKCDSWMCAWTAVKHLEAVDHRNNWCSCELLVPAKLYCVYNLERFYIWSGIFVTFSSKVN